MDSKGRFTPGDPRAGRRLGSVNKSTRDVRDVAAKLISDPIYLENLAKRLRTGEASPAVESLLWHYAYGKPRESVEVTGVDGEPLVSIVRLIRDAGHTDD